MMYSKDDFDRSQTAAYASMANDTSNPPNVLAATQTPQAYQSQESLSTHVEHAVRQYFKILDDVEPTNLYEIMLHQLEKPLLMVVLEQTQGNQSKTAEILGLNRGTLRKKLKTHQLL